jgi:hypothetical protein
MLGRTVWERLWISKFLFKETAPTDRRDAMHKTARIHAGYISENWFATVSLHRRFDLPFARNRILGTHLRRGRNKNTAVALVETRGSVRSRWLEVRICRTRVLRRGCGVLVLSFCSLRLRLPVSRGPMRSNAALTRLRGGRRFYLTNPGMNICSTYTEMIAANLGRESMT